MEKREYPAVQRALRRTMLFALPFSFFCFGTGLYLHKKGYEILGWTLEAAFGATIVWALAYMSWRLHRVRCPQCGGRAPTQKDETGNWWVANCNRCNIQWDLKTGVD